MKALTKYAVVYVPARLPHGLFTRQLNRAAGGVIVEQVSGMYTDSPHLQTSIRLTVHTSAETEDTVFQIITRLIIHLIELGERGILVKELDAEPNEWALYDERDLDELKADLIP